MLSNAFKFTRTGGTVVVSVSLQKEDDIIKVCVSDTGIGNCYLLILNIQSFKILINY